MGVLLTRLSLVSLFEARAVPHARHRHGRYTQCEHQGARAAERRGSSSTRFGECACVGWGLCVSRGLGHDVEVGGYGSYDGMSIPT